MKSYDPTNGTLAERRETYQQLLTRYQSLYRQTRAALDRQTQTIEQLRQRSVALGSAAGSLHGSFRRSLLLARRCAKLEAQIKADAYVAHDELTLITIDYMTRKHGGLFVYDAVEPVEEQDKTFAYGREVSSLEQRYYGALLRSALMRSEVRFATSAPLADYLTNKYGSKFYNLPNYLSRPISTAREPAIREECSCTADDFLMLYVNNIYRASRFEEVLAALSLCEPSLHLACVGKIYPVGHMERFTESVREYGLTARVHFLAQVPYKRYLEYISGCDGALVWLDDENVNCRLNLHNRYLDAIGAGLPVLSSLNDAFAQLNHEYGIGLIASGQNAPILAEAIASLRTQREALLPGVERARRALRWERVEERFVQAFSGCRSVTFITTKDPTSNQRLIRQIETLSRRGISVLGVGNVQGDKVTGELGTWFNLGNTEDVEP